MPEQLVGPDPDSLESMLEHAQQKLGLMYSGMPISPLPPVPPEGEEEMLPVPGVAPPEAIRDDTQVERLHQYEQGMRGGLETTRRLFPQGKLPPPRPQLPGREKTEGMQNPYHKYRQYQRQLS